MVFKFYLSFFILIQLYALTIKSVEADQCKSDASGFIHKNVFKDGFDVMNCASFCLGKTHPAFETSEQAGCGCLVAYNPGESTPTSIWPQRAVRFQDEIKILGEVSTIKPRTRKTSPKLGATESKRNSTTTKQIIKQTRRTHVKAKNFHRTFHKDTGVINKAKESKHKRKGRTFCDNRYSLQIYDQTKRKRKKKKPQKVVPMCLRFVSKRNSWNMARKGCRSLGGDLVVANTNMRFKVVKQFMKYGTGLRTTVQHLVRARAWIGLRNKLWLDGSDLKYKRFKSGIYDTGKGCVTMGMKGKQFWRYQKCETKNSFICQTKVLEH